MGAKICDPIDEEDKATKKQEASRKKVDLAIVAAVEAVQYGAADFIEKDFYVEDKLELGMEKVERMLAVLRENALSLIHIPSPRDRG